MRLSVTKDVLRRLEFVDTAGLLGTRTAQSPLIREIAAQVSAYFRDPGFRFDLPLEDAPTGFQGRLRDALIGIEPGTVRTYGALARELGSSARAIGGGCRSNPVPLVVPCHRVVSASGVGGFMGRTDGPPLGRKRRLLRHEGFEPG
ncbi:MAG: methylated-DNA--[protein]-cysteine S-methyltransferase [Gammaproteobacteria bacterium]